MAQDYGLPLIAEENRALVRSRLREVKAGSGPRETLTVEWRGQPEHLEVIQMPAGNLYYNPATHRIRAQSSHDPKQAAALADDPWSSESQAYLDRLLQVLPADPARTDPEFDELVASLKEYGQTDPGLITREGILVNGNTRRAGLVQLYGPRTRCAWPSCQKVATGRTSRQSSCPCSCARSTAATTRTSTGSLRCRNSLTRERPWR